MCGRFALFTNDEELRETFAIDASEGEHTSAYNQAPGQLVRVVVGDQPRFLSLFEWGLIPSWAKPGFKPLINARAETLTEKPSFRASALRRRCLLPADGYYEWSAETGTKRPYFLAGAGVLALAGIYDVWHGPGGEEIYGCAVVTRPASEALESLHPRMPVIVPADRWAEWLDPQTESRARVESLLQSLTPASLTPLAVSPLVGNPRVTDPDIIFHREK